jgi:hypothetical protein
LGRESGTRTRCPGTWSNNVPPSLIYIIISFVGTARDSGPKLPLFLISGCRGSVREERATKCKWIPKIMHSKTKRQ